MSAYITLYKISQAPDEFNSYISFNEKTNKPMHGFKRNKRRYKDIMDFIYYCGRNNIYTETYDRYTHYYVYVSTEYYYQGWWFKKRLFKEQNSMHYAFTRESALRLIHKYVKDINQIKELYKFLQENEINGKYIFVLSW